VGKGLAVRDIIKLLLDSRVLFLVCNTFSVDLALRFMLTADVHIATLAAREVKSITVNCWGLVITT
jgi:hypothetical protein